MAWVGNVRYLSETPHFPPTEERPLPCPPCSNRRRASKRLLSRLRHGADGGWQALLR